MLLLALGDMTNDDGQFVARRLHDIAEDTWLVKYGPVVLGTIKKEADMQRIGAPSRRTPASRKNEDGKL
jgi:hypothetical protein